MISYIYLVRAGHKYYKVGVTKDLKKRIGALQTSNPSLIELINAKLTDIPFGTEHDIHQQLTDMATGGGKEWFELSDKQLIKLCILIQSYPHVELSERVIIKDLLDRQLTWKKTVEKKMDIILNNYQKSVVRTLTSNQHPTDTPESIEIRKAARIAEQKNSEESLANRAVELFKHEGRASTSLLQRKLSIGYGRAARLMDELEEKGYVSGADGAHARQVLV